MVSKSEVIVALAALAHPARLDVFRSLVQAGREGATPTDLGKSVEPELPQSTLATHLKELVAAGLVNNERVGRNVVYRAAYDRMDGVIGFLTENCCKGLPAVETAGASSCC
ncbi:ArsR/SmtB family transcription factor [Roseateles sp. NT4]|uniref:ArsR/SmtB family transcription factor n=1 Tax=Roseateles sp. NT4 TaxID=3453715 RepID=UPI003EEE1C61